MSDEAVALAPRLPVPGPRLLLLLLLPLALAVAAAFLPDLRPWAWLGLVVAVLAAVLDWVLGMRRVAASARALPSEPRWIGQAAPFIVTLSNDSGSPLAMELALDLCAGLSAPRDRASLRIAPGEGARAAFEIRPLRRGPKPAPGLSFRVASPLGLVRIQGRATLTGAGFLVHADLREYRRGLRSVASLPFAEGERRSRARGEGTEFESLSEYRQSDDPLRAIDWKASTRAGRPVARRYSAERGIRLAVAVDCGRLMSAERGGRSTLDRACDGLLALGAAALAAGDSFRAIAFADGVVAELPEVKGRSGLPRLSSFAARLELRFVETDFSLVARRLDARRAGVGSSKRSLVLIVTDALEPERATALEAAVLSMSGRHLVVVAFVRDEELEAAARAPLGGAGPAVAAAVFAKAAATELLEGRLSVAARLRADGAQILDLLPEELAAGMLERYLALRARDAV